MINNLMPIFKSPIIRWIKQNRKSIGISSLVSVISATANSISLAVVQHVFGREADTFTTGPLTLLPKYSDEVWLMFAILIWVIPNYFLTSYINLLTSRRFDRNKKKKREAVSNVDPKTARFMINEAHFFEEFLNFFNQIVQVIAYSVVILAIAPAILKISVSTSILFLIFIGKKRFVSGYQIGRVRNDKQIKRDENKNSTRQLELFSKRNWLTARLDSFEYLIFGFLMISPFVILLFVGSGISTDLSLFEFTLFLVFFRSLIHISIQTGNLGFRTNLVFDRI